MPDFDERLLLRPIDLCRPRPIDLRRAEETSYCGIVGKSLGGTLCHAMTFGFRDPELRPRRRAREADIHIYIEVI